MLDRLATACYLGLVSEVTTRNERRVLPGALRRIRTLQSKTQDEVATAADIDFTSLSRIERGLRQPSLPAMCRLANALGVDLDDFTYMTAVYVVADDPAAVA